MTWHKIDDVEGIGPAYARKLRKAGGVSWRGKPS